MSLENEPSRHADSIFEFPTSLRSTSVDDTRFVCGAHCICLACYTSSVFESPLLGWSSYDAISQMLEPVLEASLENPTFNDAQTAIAELLYSHATVECKELFLESKFALRSAKSGAGVFAGVVSQLLQVSSTLGKTDDAEHIAQSFTRCLPSTPSSLWLGLTPRARGERLSEFQWALSELIQGTFLSGMDERTGKLLVLWKRSGGEGGKGLRSPFAHYLEGRALNFPKDRRDAFSRLYQETTGFDPSYIESVRPMSERSTAEIVAKVQANWAALSPENQAFAKHLTKTHKEHSAYHGLESAVVELEEGMRQIREGDLEKAFSLISSSLRAFRQYRVVTKNRDRRFEELHPERYFGALTSLGFKLLGECSLERSEIQGHLSMMPALPRSSAWKRHSDGDLLLK